MATAAKRIVDLVRHGQHIPTGTGGTLTPDGRAQAALIAQRLAGESIDSLTTSNLQRAVETAESIAELHPELKIRRTPLLREVTPTSTADLRVSKDRLKTSRVQVEHAVARFLKPSRTARHDVLVAHGNLIRAFVCQALGLRRKLWMDMAIDHASLTRLAVRADGVIQLIAFNDTGHLP